MTIDPISQAVITNLIKLAIETGWKQAGNQIDKRIQQQVGHAIEEYVRTYEKRHCTLKYDCLRMDNSLTLEEIYTDVQVLNTRESRRFESPEALKELFLETGRGFIFEKTTRQEGIAVANLEPRLIVLGSPGIGKSTFLRKVGLEALKWETARYRHELIPVFIELKQFGDQHSDIEKLIAEEFKTCSFPNADVFTQNLLKAGKLLILLDGLDEVPTVYVDQAISQIGTLVDKYDKNRLIASCRIAAYKGGFRRFKDVTMANFNDSQMQTFVRQWFRREPKVAEQYWQLLDSSEYKAVKELGQTPLLLTLLCAVYDESQSLPKRRSALYGEALEVWLKKWAAERRVHRDPIYQELNLQLEQVLLSEIAYQSFAEDQLFFSKRELTEQIRAFLVNNLNAPKHLDAEQVLYAIQVQQGVLVERARDIFSFSHLTFQEYLTAQYVVETQQLDMLVLEHLTDERWREVFLLVAGLLRTADGLLRQMENITRRMLSSKKLTTLLWWANELSLESEDKTQTIMRRNCALSLALLVMFERDRSYSQLSFIESLFFLIIDIGDSPEFPRHQLNSVIYNYVRDGIHHPDELRYFSEQTFHLVRNIEQAEMFRDMDFNTLLSGIETLLASTQGTEATFELCQMHRDFLHQTWLTTLHLNDEWLELSPAEVDEFNNYLYANELMIRCKEAALRVSPQVWDSIASRMLTVSDNDTM
jgi:predicted NACHT family NTPase